jgi:hypothetical protein
MKALCVTLILLKEYHHKAYPALKFPRLTNIIKWITARERNLGVLDQAVTRCIGIIINKHTQIPNSVKSDVLETN